VTNNDKIFAHSRQWYSGRRIKPKISPDDHELEVLTNVMSGFLAEVERRRYDSKSSGRRTLLHLVNTFQSSNLKQESYWTYESNILFFALFSLVLENPRATGTESWY
jgi:hypothetical protein